MFPGYPLPDHTVDQALIAPSSEPTLHEGFAAATSKAPQLPPEWAEKAAKELNETPEAVQENIKSLRRMVLGTAKSHFYLAHPALKPLWYSEFRYNYISFRKASKNLNIFLRINTAKTDTIKRWPSVLIVPILVPYRFTFYTSFLRGCNYGFPFPGDRTVRGQPAVNSTASLTIRGTRSPKILMSKVTSVRIT